MSVLLVSKCTCVNGCLWFWILSLSETEVWWFNPCFPQSNETAGCQLILFYTPLAHYVMTPWQGITVVINIKRMKKMGIQLDNLITSYYCHMHLNPEHTRKHMAYGITLITGLDRVADIVFSLLVCLSVCHHGKISSLRWALWRASLVWFVR